MERTPTGMTLSMSEASELLGGAYLLGDANRPILEALQVVGAQVDIRIELPEIESVPIRLSENEVQALYVLSKELCAMGLYNAFEKLKEQSRQVIKMLRIEWDEACELRCREDAEDYIVTASRFKALIETPENA